MVEATLFPGLNKRFKDSSFGYRAAILLGHLGHLHAEAVNPAVAGRLDQTGKMLFVPSSSSRKLRTVGLRRELLASENCFGETGVL